MFGFLTRAAVTQPWLMMHSMHPRIGHVAGRQLEDKVKLKKSHRRVGVNA